jgi:hypothetical protein
MSESGTRTAVLIQQVYARKARPSTTRDPVGAILLEQAPTALAQSHNRIVV